MQGDRLKQAETIFHAVVDLPATDREAALSERCGDDSELRAFVERLLRHHETGGGGVLDPRPSLDPPPSSSEAETAAPAALPGQTLGLYVLRERVGSGGMGEVWRAEQTSPVRRTVALKLIKAGMDSRQVLARFEAERQALALMDHPCIAKVFDAGTTPQGRPYFAMEYVPGIPITDYCDARKLGTQERLMLFQRVCEGVQHAHQKAVIHRDLKPSNILVSDVDGKPQPRIIDFGVAKATTQKLTEKTMYTAMGQLIGTPEYMSPEQADLTVEDVDTRTDVYSLGVILYELLAGALPFEAAELRKAGFEGIIRLLREKDPPRPSTKVSSLGERTAEVAQNRRTEPRRLVGQLRGDLDWIVMRSLEKDRNRRYASPLELVQDIARHLNHEPVLAGPPSPAYRSKKFVRRHRVPLAFIALVFLGITGGLIQSNRQRLKVESALATAREERARAVREAEKAEQVSQFVQEMLGSNDPFDENYAVSTPEERDFARRLLDRAAENVDTELADQPEVLADIRGVLGVTYMNLGFYDAARPHLEASLALRRELFGNHHADVATSLEQLGELAIWDWTPREAKSFLLEALKIRRAIQGGRHPDVATTLHLLGDVESNWSPEGPVFSSSPGGSLAQGERYLLESLEIRRETGDVSKRGIADCLNSLASVHRMRGDYQQAVSLGREALETRLARVDPEHYSVSWDLHELALSLMSGGDPAAAEPLLRRAHAIRKKVLPESHFYYTFVLGSLGDCLRQQRKFASADSFLVEAVTLDRKHQPPEWHIYSMGRLARSYQAQGRYREAEELHRGALEISRNAFGEADGRTHAMMRNLAYSYRDQGRYREAEELLRETLEIQRTVLGETDPGILVTMKSLAKTCEIQGRSDEAEPLRRGILEIYRRSFGEEDRRTLNAISKLGDCYSLQRRYDEAEALHRETLEIRLRVLGEEDPRTLASMRRLAAACSNQGRHDEAATLRQEALMIGRRVQGESHPTTNGLRYDLARDLAIEGRHDEAISFLRVALSNGYRGPPNKSIVDDLNLVSLHGHPEFEAIVAELKRRRGEDVRTKVE